MMYLCVLPSMQLSLPSFLPSFLHLPPFFPLILSPFLFPSSLSYFFIDFFIFIYVYVCFAWMCVHMPLCAGFMEARRQQRTLLELESQTVVSCLWVLGIEPRSSGRAASVLNHRAISPPCPLPFHISSVIFNSS